MNELPDIPRIYTALAECLACFILIPQLKKRVNISKLISISAVFLVWQAVFLVFTENLPIELWIPCMLLAVGFMLLYILVTCEVSILDAAYYGLRAFVIAEFVASLQWQVHCFYLIRGKITLFTQIMWLVLIYGLLYLLLWFIERRHAPEGGTMNITGRELFITALMGFSIFGISNLNFIFNTTPFSGTNSKDIFNVRTMVDLGGVAIMLAYHIQCKDNRVRRELEAMQSVLRNQYLQYTQSKESIELINYKYHDLKHQIAFLRAEKDSSKREEFLNQMEAEIKDYEAQNKTGNQVLDTVLNIKSLYCNKNGITMTCVADGSLLECMEAMDICTIFGNALDNAIESSEEIENEEKRLIHVMVSSQKDFLIIRVENYSEKEPVFNENLPVSTKTNQDLHGYGLKSIRHTAAKYGGAVNISYNNNWFELQILIPKAGSCDENP